MDDCTYEVRISPHTRVPYININYVVTINNSDTFAGCFIRTVAMYANCVDVSSVFEVSTQPLSARDSQFCWRCTCLSEHVRRVCHIVCTVTSVYMTYNITLSLQASMSFMKIRRRKAILFLTGVNKIIFRACSLRRYYVFRIWNAVANFVYFVTAYTICTRVL